MRSYEYTESHKKYLSSEIICLIGKINEFKGVLNLSVEIEPELISGLIEVAKIQSVDSSNKIEGILTSNDRLKKIIANKTTPTSSNEEEITGYRDVLKIIHESYAHIPFSSNHIMQLHKYLYSYSANESGGKYKCQDNIIEEIDSKGNKKIRFQPLSAWETPEAIEAMVSEYNKSINGANVCKLVITAMSILDFLCIHPFGDGNGRISRLLTVLLLYKAEYQICKYISIERIIEASKETYYEVLEQSSINWQKGENNYEPFIRYMLGVILKAYREFDERARELRSVKVSKPKQIENAIKTSLGVISKAEIMSKCPNISLVTVQRTLAELSKQQKIIKVGSGKNIAYIWNNKG